MTIRLRLIGLVVIANIFLIFSLVYVNIRFAEIDAIRDEQLLLTEMRQTLNAESRGLMDFLISSFNTSIEEYQLLSSATDTAFESGRNNIVILPDMDDVVSKALDSVFGLNDLMNLGFAIYQPLFVPVGFEAMGYRTEARQKGARA